MDHVAAFFILDDGAVARELLLDHLENLLGVEFGWDALDGRQCLATITLLDADVDVWTGLDKAEDSEAEVGRNVLV